MKLFILSALAALSLATASEIVEPCQIPYQAFIKTQLRDKVRYCSGALVHPEFVVTPAHCIGETNEGVKVALGSQKLDGPWPYEQTATAQVIHPGYYKSYVLNDLALLRIPAVTGDVLKLIKVAGNDTGELVNAKVRSSGFGNEMVKDLVKDDMQVISSDTCRKYHLKFPHYMCVTHVGEWAKDSVCNGHNGALLVQKNSEGAEILVGLASFINRNKCHKHPQVFTRMSSYGAWIEAEIKKFQ